MHVYIVYAHPAPASFNREVLHAFIRGLDASGHAYEVGDLYRMGFKSEMDFEQYRREVSFNPHAQLPTDVIEEHEKVSRSDALVFIYPNWWSDCPAKLKGWFDRVWAYGYAYFYDSAKQRQTKISVNKGLAICTSGHTLEELEETGIAVSMRRIMLNDRMTGIGIREARMEILGGMMPGVNIHREENLQRAYNLGLTL